MSDYANYISYMITELFCIFFSIGIIVKANNNVGTDLQMRHFKGMALFFSIYLASDSWWALGQGGLIPFSRTLNKLTSAVGLIAVSLLMLAWCIFVIYRIGLNNTKVLKAMERLHYAVAGADCLLMISSIFTEYVFYVDEDCIYHTGDGFILHLVLVFIQLFGSGIFSFVQSFANNQAKLKKEYRLPLIFIIVPAIASVLEEILPLCPIVPLGIFLAIHLAFLEIQNSEIYSDALTGLSNRRRMEIFLQDMIRDASDENPFRIYMIDVNDFKQVNDKYGHIAGDRTLQLVADSLRIVSEKRHGFSARYGGDEFVLIIREEAPVGEEIQNELNILRESMEDEIPTVSVCAGSAECRSSAVTAAQLIAKADEQLYVLKEIFHGRRSPEQAADDN